MRILRNSIAGIYGETIFVSEFHGLWDMRQEIKQAYLNGQEAKSYLISHEEMYYTNMLDQVLSDSEKLQDSISEILASMSGVESNRLRCALLWEQPGRGVLLHKDGDHLCFAFYPPITYQIAKREHETAMRLSAIACEAENLSIQLDNAISAGEHKLSEVLEYLSEQIDV